VVFWLAALALAGVAASAVASSPGTSDDATASGDTERVPVSVGDFERGHHLEPGDVEWRDLPESAIPEHRAGKTDGRVVIEPIAEGEVVIEARLAPEHADGTTALLPPDTRAIAIPLTLGAPPLEIGDRVDLLATLDVSAADAAARQRAVARNATVVAVEDDAVTVAVERDEADGTAVALGNGAVIIALVSVE
jgi:Flp pilus assembly protein CpaB